MKVRRIVAERDGAAAVEFAVIAPVLAFCTLVCMQLAVIFFAYLSVLNAARDTARWVAQHPNTVDSVSLATATADLPPNLDAARLTMAVLPACSALVQNKCPNRAAGQDVAVTMTYDLTSVYFIPSTFDFLPGIEVRLPTSLPAYTLHMQAEPT
ncbi:MAG: pilus assembly protein [Chloroflexi bacterium]|nr:pilus assembly protein [Chloroflexota bacterium]